MACDSFWEEGGLRWLFRGREILKVSDVFFTGSVLPCCNISVG